MESTDDATMMRRIFLAKPLRLLYRDNSPLACRGDDTFACYWHQQTSGTLSCAVRPGYAEDEVAKNKGESKLTRRRECDLS